MTPNSLATLQGKTSGANFGSKASCVPQPSLSALLEDCPISNGSIQRAAAAASGAPPAAATFFFFRLIEFGSQSIKFAKAEAFSISWGCRSHSKVLNQISGLAGKKREKIWTKNDLMSSLLQCLLAWINCFSKNLQKLKKNCRFFFH